MTSLEFLSNIPNHGEFSRSSKVLLFAFYLRKFSSQLEFTSTDIRTCFSVALIRVPSDLSAMLKQLSQGRTPPIIKGSKKNYYVLSIHGLNEVDSILPTNLKASSGSAYNGVALEYLQKVLARLPSGQRKDFLAEAISCLGVEARRASIIITWLVVVDHLYDFAFTHKLSDFQIALQRRTGPTSQIVINTREDFSNLKEAVFIEVLKSAGIITADVRKILDEKLGFRNSCAHPSTIAVGEAKVVSFIEDLVDNVIIKYPI